MKVSQLRQREPIDDIVASTLSRFWSARYGDSFSADWHPRHGDRTAIPWTCNAWLNVIFPPAYNVSHLSR